MIDSWNKLPIGKYIEIAEIAENSDDLDIDAQVSILSILADMTPDDVLALPIGEFSQMSETARFLYKEMAKPDAARVGSRFVLRGRVFRPLSSIDKMNASQFIDFQTYARIKERDTTIERLSCMLIPDGHTYGDGYDIQEAQQLIRDYLPVTDARNMDAFFLDLCVRYCRRFLNCSAKMARKIRTPQRKAMKQQVAAMISALNGVGLRGLTALPNVAALRGKQYLTSEY